MSDFVFPFQWRELSRAIDWLNEREDIPHTIMTDDFLSWWQQGEIELCYHWEPYGLLVPDYFNFMGFHEGYNWNFYIPGDSPQIAVKSYGTNDDYKTIKVPKGSPDDPDWLEDISVNGLVVPRAEMTKVYQLLSSNLDNKVVNSSISNYTERHAANRELLYKVAIGVLSDYPDECKGSRKEFSPEKWADAIQNHAGEYPPLQILNRETIIKHLRLAVNIKNYTG